MFDVQSFYGNNDLKFHTKCCRLGSPSTSCSCSTRVQGYRSKDENDGEDDRPRMDAENTDLSRMKRIFYSKT